ncbi:MULTISPECIES: hypothetical protein [unclassified Streptomyces]|uniref:hypothetical protein n=1 Tax=unclassified Streptomyces TaxID=2593676 RepID=UPI00114E3D29|nr:hypothetical protein [Streptomyces sp. SLBN-31]
MSVTWAATALQSGRFCPVERCSGIAELADHFDELRCRGQGYLEVRRQGDELPLLALGFRGDLGVLHLFDDAEGASLLVGDGIVAAEALVGIPVLDDLAAFNGRFVLSVDRAWDLVGHFLATGTPGELGEWCDV